MLSTYKIQDSKSEIASESSYGYQPKIVVFFLNGVPGAGKGTQCEKLLEMLPNYRSLSTGALLRDLAAGSSPRAQEIARQMECGELVDIDATKELLIPQFKKYLNQNISMFIIDGFPRDRRILKDWKNGMKDERYMVPFMIEFDCDEDIAVNRLLARKRSDDTEEAIRNRINVFKQKTGEIMNIFKKQKKYRQINSNGNKQDISKDLYNLIVPYYKYFEFIKQIYNQANQLYNNNNDNNYNNNNKYNNNSSINNINDIDNNIAIVNNNKDNNNNNNSSNGSNIYNRIVAKTLYMVAQCLENENIMSFIMAIVIGGNYCCRQVLTCTKVTYLLILGILIFTISSIQFFV